MELIERGNKEDRREKKRKKERDKEKKLAKYKMIEIKEKIEKGKIILQPI